MSMICEASTGRFIVRRCRSASGLCCTHCQKYYCDQHFDKTKQLCLVCSAGPLEQNEDTDPHFHHYRDPWNDYFYTTGISHRSHHHYDDYRDHEAFDEITTAPDNTDRLYDS